MGRAFVYVILGGGVAAGYAALEFVRRGVSSGELCIISDETVAPYERPALSKGFLLPEAPARLPSFHTCVGANDERLTPKWYQDHGIELILGTRVKHADVNRKTLITESGEAITYKILIIATGARAIKLEELGVKGSDAKNVCYLRNLADATRLVEVMQSCPGGNAVVIGGGYIAMECTAALVTNKFKVTMVFPKAHIMARLFTPEMATFYETFYGSKGVKLIKNNAMSSFSYENDAGGKVEEVILRDGTRLPADMVVVGIGVRPNSGLFAEQLDMGRKGSIKVNGRMQTSNNSVYAVGDVAAFPVKLFGNNVRRRLEHVDSARRTARHAVAAIMAPETTGDLDYLPFFYSRVFTLSWQFYGDNVGKVVHYGDFSDDGRPFGAYWVDKGHIVGAFLEGGSKEEYEAIAKTVKLKMPVRDDAELGRAGVEFAMRMIEQQQAGTGINSNSSMEKDQKPPLMHPWHATAGVVVALSVAAFACWYQIYCRR